MRPTMIAHLSIPESRKDFVKALIPDPGTWGEETEGDQDGTVTLSGYHLDMDEVEVLLHFLRGQKIPYNCEMTFPFCGQFINSVAIYRPASASREELRKEVPLDGNFNSYIDLEELSSILASDLSNEEKLKHLSDLLIQRSVDIPFSEK